MALPGPASVLLSLWRVDQRERGQEPPEQGPSEARQDGVGPQSQGVLTAHHQRGWGGSLALVSRADATPPPHCWDRAGRWAREGG